MAGTITMSLTQRLDNSTHLPLSGGLMYFIQAGTTATPQNAYQDSALTIPFANPLTLDSGGNIPQLFFADGVIKVRITNSLGVQQFAQDNIQVTGASSGSGGGGTVDPTTILQTGWLQPIYGTGVVTGFVRANGRTIGSASSGATERANADTVALYTFLYNQDANLAVSGGRGLSAAADYAANKTIALPDWRGRGLAFLDDMGNSAASRLTASYFGTSAIVLGASGGLENSQLLSQNNLPNVNFLGTIPGYGGAGATNVTPYSFLGSTGFIYDGFSFTPTVPKTISVTSGGTSSAFKTVSPMMLATLYIKL